jgi:nicotinic acid phosphoribosyltransferase
MIEQKMQPAPSQSLLLTDFYQLTMLQAYWAAHMTETAVFELSVRKLPPTRNFLMDVRRILDAGGLYDVMIYVSGGLDEDKLRDLVSCDAPIAGFGIGTNLVTSSDAPAPSSSGRCCPFTTPTATAGSG